MSLYVGTSSNSADLIASTISRKTIENLIDQYYLPKVGDVKYLAIPAFQAIDIASDSFDGWIYANGQTFTGIGSNQFKEAKVLFGASENATSFTVPNLCYFAKALPSNDQYSYQQSDVPCNSHVHDIDTTINYNSNNSSFILSTAFKIAVTDTGAHQIVHPDIPHKKKEEPKRVNITKATWYDYITSSYPTYIPGLHGPDKSVSGNDHIVYVDLNIPAAVDFSVLPTKTAGEDHPNVYPSHILLAVMIYIGKSR